MARGGEMGIILLVVAITVFIAGVVLVQIRLMKYRLIGLALIVGSSLFFLLGPRG